jgi:hypothetical protein
VIGDDSRKGRLANTGRPPQNHGWNRIIFNRNSERFTLPHKMLLSDEISKRLWAELLGKRLGWIGHNLDDRTLKFGTTKICIPKKDAL